jgi:hypothetical protein
MHIKTDKGFQEFPKKNPEIFGFNWIYDISLHHNRNTHTIQAQAVAKKDKLNRKTKVMEQVNKLNNVTNHTIYIKDGDGDMIYLNRKGREIATQFIARNGGISAVNRKTKISRPTLTLIKKEGRCAPEIWERLYGFINPNLQPAA